MGDEGVMKLSDVQLRKMFSTIVWKKQRSHLIFEEGFGPFLRFVDPVALLDMGKICSLFPRQPFIWQITALTFACKVRTSSRRNVIENSFKSSSESKFSSSGWKGREGTGREWGDRGGMGRGLYPLASAFSSPHPWLIREPVRSLRFHRPFNPKPW